mmetsp:Transcript_7271/g.17108  ORF Transcript_7271/g.17108 Transcript_7271/m.17108 type:complete len:87 (+) Transcript_7271:483-743(+)
MEELHLQRFYFQRILGWNTGGRVESIGIRSRSKFFLLLKEDNGFVPPPTVRAKVLAIEGVSSYFPSQVRRYVEVVAKLYGTILSRL